MMKRIQAALGLKFKEARLEYEDVTSQTATQKEAVKTNITGTSVPIKTNKSEDNLVMLDSTVLDD